MWKAIPGYEGFYEVSDQGEVRALERMTRNGRVRKQRVLKPGYDRGGYLKIDLSRDNKQTSRTIHSLVTEAFLGPPNGLQCRHENGIRNDNRLQNLNYGTAKENAADRARHGTPYGRGCPKGLATAAARRYNS